MRKLWSIVLFMVMISGFVCKANADPIKIKFAGISPLEFAGTKSMIRIAERMEKETCGRVKIKVFPASQLGDGLSIFTEIKRGTIEMGCIFLIAQYDKMLEVGSLPYLAENFEQMKKLLVKGSYFFSLMDKTLAKQGIKLLGYRADGFVGVGSTKEIANVKVANAPKGVLARIPAMEVYKLTTEALGYRTTTIPWADTFSAAQSGVCDAWMGAPAEINYLLMGDIIKYYVPYNNSFDQCAYIISGKVWDKLQPQDRDTLVKIVEDEVKRSCDEGEATEKKYIRLLKEKGCKVVEFSPEEISKIADHVRSVVWPKMESQFGKEVLENLLKDIKKN